MTSRKQVVRELFDSEELLFRQTLAFHEEIQQVARTDPQGKLLINCATILEGSRELYHSRNRYVLFKSDGA